VTSRLALSWLMASRAYGRASFGASRRYASDLATVFPQLDGDALHCASRELEANRFTREALRLFAAGSGWSFMPDLVSLSGGEALLSARAAGPAIVVAWHSGFGSALLAALHRLGQDGVVARHRQGAPLLGFSTVRSTGPIRCRTEAFLTLLARVRAGGLAVLFIDIRPPGRRVQANPVTLFDRSVELPRGPAALRRLSGAPIFCAETRWTGAPDTPFQVRLEELGTAGGSDAEAALTDGLARYFETRLSATPSDLWPASLRLLAAAPRTAERPPRSAA
jgi:lauroyl/myristoyl acyltransferase